MHLQRLLAVSGLVALSSAVVFHPKDVGDIVEAKWEEKRDDDSLAARCRDPTYRGAQACAKYLLQDAVEEELSQSASRKKRDGDALAANGADLYRDPTYRTYQVCPAPDEEEEAVKSDAEAPVLETNNLRRRGNCPLCGPNGNVCCFRDDKGVWRSEEDGSEQVPFMPAEFGQGIAERDVFGEAGVAWSKRDANNHLLKRCYQCGKYCSNCRCCAEDEGGDGVEKEE